MRPTCPRKAEKQDKVLVHTEVSWQTPVTQVSLEGDTVSTGASENILSGTIKQSLTEEANGFTVFSWNCLSKEWFEKFVSCTSSDIDKAACELSVQLMESFQTSTEDTLQSTSQPQATTFCWTEWREESRPFMFGFA